MDQLEDAFSKTPISNPNSLRQAIENGLIVLSYAGEQDYYECLVCQRGMSGSIPAQAHLHGTPHLKALLNSSGKSVVCDPESRFVPPAFFSSSRYQVTTSSKHNSTAHLLKPHRHDTDAVELALRKGLVREERVSCQRVFTCTVCKISCTGNIPMSQHLRGESHSRKQSKMNIKRRNLPQASRHLETTNDSFSKSSTSSPSLSPLPSSTELHHSTSKMDGGSLDKDLDQSVVVEGTMGSTEEYDFNNLSCEDYQLNCNGATPMEQQLQGAMRCDLRTSPEQVSRAQHENEKDSNTEVTEKDNNTQGTGKATKRYTQPVSKEGINNELSEIERQSCSTAAKSNLTTLLHHKDFSEETEMIMCVLRDLKESVNELRDNFNSNEVMTKKLDERFSSVVNDTSQNLARLNSEVSQLTAKLADQEHEIADLKEQITFQNSEINYLRNLNTIRDDKISNLLMHIKQLFE